MDFYSHAIYICSNHQFLQFNVLEKNLYNYPCPINLKGADSTIFWRKTPFFTVFICINAETIFCFSPWKNYHKQSHPRHLVHSFFCIPLNNFSFLTEFFLQNRLKPLKAYHSKLSFKLIMNNDSSFSDRLYVDLFQRVFCFCYP